MIYLKNPLCYSRVPIGSYISLYYFVSTKPYPMNRLILSFPSVFDLYDFKKQTNISNSEAIVNRLTGHFTQEEIQIATTVFKAEVIKELQVARHL